ncbi:MAG: hypothetical protein U0270_21320 [Labilithrix sp.]
MTGEGDSFRASSPLVAPSTFAWFMGIPCLLGFAFALTGRQMGRNGVPVSAAEGLMIQLGGALVCAVSAVAVAAALVPTQVWVDAEGIHLRWLWRRVSIPHAAITDLAIHSASPANGLPEQPRAVRVTHAHGSDLVGLVGTEAQRFLAIVNARRATVVATIARQ